MLMPFPSIIVALTSFIVGPDESTSTVTHSPAHLRAVFRQRRGFPVIVSDRQMTSACPRVALGRRHLLLIKQNKGGLWWYHLGVAPPPPTLSLSHDRRLPFPSNRVSVSLLCVRMKIWWSPPSAKPSPPALYRDPPPLPRLRLLISHFSARNEYLSQKLADRTHVLKCWLNEFFQ